MASGVGTGCIWGVLHSGMIPARDYLGRRSPNSIGLGWAGIRELYDEYNCFAAESFSSEFIFVIPKSFDLAN